MFLQIQRVSQASLIIDSRLIGTIEEGLLVYIGIEKNDSIIDNAWISKKLHGLRVFNDTTGKMNLSIKDIGGGLMVIPNFTLAGDIRKGFRPSFSNAKEYDIAKDMFSKLISNLEHDAESININFISGIFGADMKVSSTNDGPVNILLQKHFS